MSRYTCVKSVGINGTIGYFPGDIVEIKKIKHPIVLTNGEKVVYKEVSSGELMSKKYIKEYFKKGGYKNGMLKHILKLLFTLATYELGKYLTDAVVEHCRYREDEVDTINTFNEMDHVDLKRIVAEVSE